ncbi:(2Fe-2S) ferredoxin domain-containing protein [Synechococcus sp. R3-13]|uniref:(2Fe-2S) ferredoxin domain-containing protein n=1 Tax=Synechococcus sp. R3-13 TaxID=2421316 RepID=UPI0039C2B087
MPRPVASSPILDPSSATGSPGQAPQPAPIPPYQWHLFLCADQTKPKCCEKAVGLEAWDYLKSRIKELNLEIGSGGSLRVHRTKANCLRACDYAVPGPVLLVYPGGFWYHSVTPEVVEEILQKHILGGIPVVEYLVAQDTLSAPDPKGHG